MSENRTDDEPNYKPIFVKGATFQNSTNRYCVIIGAYLGGTPSGMALSGNNDSSVIQVLDQSGNKVDMWAYAGSASAGNLNGTSGSAATVVQVSLPRHLLVPPGGSTLDPSSLVQGLSIIECKTIDFALVIL